LSAFGFTSNLVVATFNTVPNPTSQAAASPPSKNDSNKETVKVLQGGRGFNVDWELD